MVKYPCYSVSFLTFIRKENEDLNRDEKELGMWICHASRLFVRRMDQQIADAGTGDDTLSGRNFWVLKYLDDHAGEAVYQRDLEQKFKVRRSSVSNMIDLMEQKGFLAREASPTDARLKRLILTGKGKEQLRKVTETIKRFEDSIRKSFAPQDYENLLRLLVKFCDTMEQEQTERKEPET